MKSLKGLKYELGFSINELEDIVYNIDSFYYNWEKKKQKADGTIKTRILYPSKGKLKQIQKQIAKKILSKIELLPNIHGGVVGKCNITNARPHLGKKFHLCTDIKEFFPSVKHRQVYQMFIDNDFSPKIASLLTKLTTYKRCLPQGTPTSTAIANLVFQKVDFEILKICSKNKITYSRFVDDLVFSSQNCFKDKQYQILSIFNKYGFERSHKKTFYKAGPIEVTGIVVKHNKLDITDVQKAKLTSKETSELSRIGLQIYASNVKASKKT